MAKRGISITLGTLVLIGVVGYGPAVLLGPLPEPDVTVAAAPASAAPVHPPVLPETGATAVAQQTTVLAHAGDASALPISGAARLVTALVVAQRYPLTEGPGQNITISEDNYNDFVARAGAGASTVSFYPGDVWTQHSMLQAMLLGGSTNHADALATWAYGSREGFLEAVKAWASKEGLTSLVITDAGGVDLGNVASASDLARISALAAADPGITAALTEAPDPLALQRGMSVPSAYLPDAHIQVLYRGYTDQTGIILLFARTMKTDAGDFTFGSASLRSATWKTLEAETLALLASADAGVTAAPDLAAGTPLLSVSTAWEQKARGLSGETPARPHWAQTAPKLDVSPGKIPVPVASGTPVGTVNVESSDPEIAEQKIPVLLDTELTEPDVLWRLSHPLPMIQALWTKYVK
ncbi:hypothetical protein D9V34_11470 [Mycetocola lacteus]|uniref:Peptidase S11 D-alanyl-D-alanine carboxypeptidase A N-terminal domain-containing protein n=1 Tax=Mycetocola lacteus TaxID=76637 RepID=A0A3L7ARX2_9MICO|nr:hypothetical protein [Mycetocola lacteus]RLP82391.1 hypothetical protein D9V34_11470 [Mycetocola lacteus]